MTTSERGKAYRAIFVSYAVVLLPFVAAALFVEAPECDTKRYGTGCILSGQPGWSIGVLAQGLCVALSGAIASLLALAYVHMFTRLTGITAGIVSAVIGLLPPIIIWAVWVTPG